MKKLIGVINLNPCRDKSIAIDRFERGGLNRVVSTREDMCGKGVNVAIALKNLGYGVVCAGFNFKNGGADLEKSLTDKNVAFDFIDCPGNVRTNIKLFENQTKIMTEINEKGGFVDQNHVDELMDKISTLAVNLDVLALSGSAPSGVSPGIYADIIKLARDRAPRIKIFLDADGELMREGLKQKPFFIKPNLFELGNIFGRVFDPEDHKTIIKSCRELIAAGLEVALVSMGKDGAIIIDEKEAFYSPAMDEALLKIKGLQGAGDSMVAGACAAAADNKPLGVILKYAVAAAAGTVSREGALICEKSDFNKYINEASIYEKG